MAYFFAGAIVFGAGVMIGAALNSNANKPKEEVKD